MEPTRPCPARSCRRGARLIRVRAEESRKPRRRCGPGEQKRERTGSETEAVVSDLDAFEFGREQWDLITSFCLHAWHRRSKTDVPQRIYDAMRPGGLLVIEGFAEPPNTAGFQSEQLAVRLAVQFAGMQILTNETVTDHAESRRRCRWCASTLEGLNKGCSSNLYRCVQEVGVCCDLLNSLRRRAYVCSREGRASAPDSQREWLPSRSFGQLMITPMLFLTLFATGRRKRNR